MLGLDFTTHDVFGDPRFISMDSYTSWPAPVPLWLSLAARSSMVLRSLDQTPPATRPARLLFWKSNKVPAVAALPCSSSDDLPPFLSLFGADVDPVLGTTTSVTHWLEKIDFTTDATLAFPAVLVVDSWMWIPFMALMTLAALGSVPAELEAANG